ncbi:MAG: S41 family peptidase [Acidobacteriota bacterium]|nr:S41 family peptidase [Acidobacteriota bacterium]
MKNGKILLFLILFVWLFGTNENISAQKRKSPPRRNVGVKTTKIFSVVPPRALPPEQQRRLDSFNFVWQTIKSNYFDQTFSGLDWDKIKKEFEPRVLKTASDNQLHDILQEMINRLDRSHFAVIPPEVYQAIERAKAEAKAKDEKQIAANEQENSEEVTEEDIISQDYSARFGIGIDLRLIDNRFVITRIEKNSAAETAGLKTGYTIEKVNDVSLAELLKQIEIYYANIRNIKRHLSAQIIDSMLNGEKDSYVILTVAGEIEPPREIKVQREKLKGEAILLGKNYPEQFLRFETASLNDEVGFVKFNLFALPIVEKFCSAMTQLKDKKAIIIDLRGNGGGILGSLVGLGGMLTEKSIDLGTSIYKIGSENMVALSKAKNYKGKIVFLVDNRTVSAAEIFAAALQENNRALIVGEKTAGEALPSVSVELSTGAVLLYPIANFKTRNGNFLEGKGVEPNFVVALDRKSLLAGEDKQLETALRVIKENKAFPQSLEGAVTIITGDRNSPPPPPPPPAPKPIPTQIGKKLAEVTIKAVNPPLPPKTIDKKDVKALQIIADFINKIGGAEAYNKINSYTLKGKSAINVRGSKTDLEINIFRQKPGKYAEIMKSEVLGEVRQIYNEKKAFVQADYGLNTDLTTEFDTARIEIFAPINNLIKNDTFKSITYQGIFDRQGRKAHVIEAKTAEYTNVAMAFDVETKLLVSYIQQFYVVSYGDYRQIENLLLPFDVEREGFMNIELEEIKLNTPIEESNFMKKENCFDRAN